jgi:hypothetical protein
MTDINSPPKVRRGRERSERGGARENHPASRMRALPVGLALLTLGGDLKRVK